MDRRRLQLFVILAEELHYGHAARRAATTQSVVSVQVRRLEDEVGTALFRRTTRAVALTRAGTLFLEEARAVLIRLDQARLAARAIGEGAEGRLRIGYTVAMALGLVPRIVGAFRRARPGVVVTLHELGTVEQEAALAERAIDAGFLHPPIDLPSVALTMLGDEPLVAIAAPEYPFDMPGDLAWSGLARHPLVFFARRRAPRFHDEILGKMHAVGETAHVVAEASSFGSAVTMAAAGIGVALVPCSLAVLHGGLCIARSLPPDAPRIVNALAVPMADAASEPWATLAATAARVAAQSPSAARSASQNSGGVEKL